MKNDVMNALKLTSADLESITEKLHTLTAANAKVPSLAYAGATSKESRCGCKGSCDGGCTSW